jgi:hypothetical protein
MRGLAIAEKEVMQDLIGFDQNAVNQLVDITN